MNWYYVEQGQRVGPLNEEQLTALLQAGKINADTLVWHEGMTDWVPFKQVESDLKSSATTAGAPFPPLSTAEGATPEAVCAECGRMFPMDEMIRHGNVRVCANCKPIFMQKLSEGAEILPPGELRYAGVLIRFVAVFLDGLILIFVNILIGLLSGLTLSQSVGIQPKATVTLQVIFFIFQAAIGIAYETIMIGKYGATLGKMAMKIKVVTADGRPVTYLRALARYFAKLLSSFTCLIGYIIAFFDKPQRRALHDHLCNTRVINRPVSQS